MQAYFLDLVTYRVLNDESRVKWIHFDITFFLKSFTADMDGHHLYITSRFFCNLVDKHTSTIYWHAVKINRDHARNRASVKTAKQLVGVRS